MSPKLTIPNPRSLKTPAQTPERSDEELITWKASIHRDTSRTPRPSINSLLVMAFLFMVFVLQGYMTFPLPDLVTLWLHLEKGETLQTLTEPIMYTFQIPVCLFIGALLGVVPGTLSILIYILLGLFFAPLFASGGGLHYLSEPGFGYFIGMFAGTLVCAKVMNTVYKPPQSPLLSWAKLLLNSAFSVLTVHAIGIAGLLLLMLFGIQTLPDVTHWATHLSASPILYDFAATLTLFGLVRPLRYLLWAIIY